MARVFKCDGCDKVPDPTGPIQQAMTISVIAEHKEFHRADVSLELCASCANVVNNGLDALRTKLDPHWVQKDIARMQRRRNDA